MDWLSRLLYMKEGGVTKQPEARMSTEIQRWHIA